MGDAIAAMRAVDALHESSAAKEIREAVEGRSMQRAEISAPEDEDLDLNLYSSAHAHRNSNVTVS
jgi:hypothetical protein